MSTLMGSRPQPTSYNRYGTDTDKEKKEKEKKLRGRNKARTRSTPSGSGVPTGLTGRNKPKNLKQKKRDSVIEEVKKAQKRLVKKPVTTGGKNPRSLNYPTGPSASKRATPEGGRAGFMAGMTGGQSKKKTPTKSRMQKDQDMISGIGAQAAKRKTPTKKNEGLGIMGMGLGSKTSRQRVEDAVKQGVKMPDTRPKKRAVTKSTATDKPKRSFMSSGAKRTTATDKPKRSFMSSGAQNKKTTTATDKPKRSFMSSGATDPRKAKKPLFGEGDAKTRGGKANVSKKQLDAFGGTLTQYMNQWNKSGKRPTKASTVSKTTDEKKTTTKKVEPKKKSFRERRLDRMGERLASAKSEGRKRRIKRRMERVKGRMADDEKKPKKKMAGGMMKAKGKANGGMMKAKGMKVGGKTNFPDLTGDGEVTRKDILRGRGVRGMKGGGMKTKGYMAGGKMKTKGYSAGGVKKAKAKKLRGAGIESRGYRRARMY